MKFSQLDSDATSTQTSASSEAIIDAMDQALRDAAVPQSAPRLATVPDAGAAELLAPVAPSSATSQPPLSSAASPNQATDLDFPDQPDDLPRSPSPPIDPATERAAWMQLLAFINAHKDPGTIVEAADPDAFMHGLD